MPPKKTAKQSPVEPIAERAAPAGWPGIASLAVTSDGRAFAGSRGGQGAACGWNVDGTLAWTTELPANHPELAVDINIAPSAVFAYARGSRTAWVLDPRTGAIAARHDVPPQFGVWVRSMRMSPDGTRVIARTGTNAQLFALPGFAHVAILEKYCNEEPITFSYDRAHAAVNGHEIWTCLR